MRQYGTYCLLALALLVACSKAPDGVISEGDMARLIADLNKAEVYVGQYSEEYDDDSTKMVLKQSIFAKHGVNQQLYDRSLDWYGHNMDVYTDVCEHAIRLLQDERRELNRKAQRQGQDGSDISEAALAHSTHRLRGDTADLWVGRRAWMLTSGMQQGTIRWDIQPDNEKAPGDRYQLALKLNGNAPAMTVTLAADYTDGATTTISRQLPNGGWARIALQTDSTREVRRVYGFIRYEMQPLTFATLDSVQLLRTRLDRANYAMMGTQVTVDRNNSVKVAREDVVPMKARRLPDEQQRRELEDAQAQSQVVRPRHIRSR